MSLASSTILDRAVDASSDVAAIADLQASIALQASAFRRNPYPAAAERVERRAVVGLSGLARLGVELVDQLCAAREQRVGVAGGRRRELEQGLPSQCT